MESPILTHLLHTATDTSAVRPAKDFQRLNFIYNNNNTHVNVYSAVIMTTRSLREFTRFLMNVEQRQAAVDPQTKPPDLGCESACFRQLSSTTTIAIYYYYSARKLILIYRPTEGSLLS